MSTGHEIPDIILKNAGKILDNIRDAVFVESFDGVIIYVNKAATDIYGYSREEFIERGIDIIVPDEEKNKIPYIFSKLRDRGMVDFEAVNVHKDGSLIPVEILGETANIDGMDVAVITLRDLRHRKTQDNLLKVLGTYGWDATLISDSDGRVIFWNSAAEKLFGYTREEAMNRKFYELIIPEPRKFENYFKEFQDRYMDFEQMYIPNNVIRPFTRKDGSIFMGEATHSVIKANGKIYGIGIVRDISKKIQNEIDLKTEKEKYEQILNNMLNAVFIIQDEKVVYVNNAFCTLSGYSVNELIGESFLMIVHPDEREKILENYEKRMRGMNVPEEYVMKLIRKSGEARWVLLRASIIDFQGKKADLASMMDVTKMKNIETNLVNLEKTLKKMEIAVCREEMYRAVWEMLHTSLFIDFITIVELHHGRITTVDSFGDASGILSHYGKLEYACIADALKYNRSIYIPHPRKEKRCTFEYAPESTIYILPIKVENSSYGVMIIGKHGFYSLSREDRSFIDLLNSHLSLSLKNLESVRRLSSSKNFQELLVRILAHDLKTHMAVIRGYADLLDETPNKEYLFEIKNVVDNVLEIIDKMKLFSKLDVERINTAKNMENVLDLIEDTILLVKNKNPAAKIRVSGENATVLCYPTLFKEMLYNLINNAFTHGAKEVSVSIKEKEKKVIIRVADNGPGIPPEIREKIFDPFFKYKSDGSGLGLAIVMRIVEMHNGKLWFDENEPKGSVFVIEIPKGEQWEKPFTLEN